MANAELPTAGLAVITEESKLGRQVTTNLTQCTAEVCSSAWMRPQRNEMADFNLSGFERRSNRKFFVQLLCSLMSLLLFLLKSFLIFAFLEGLSTEIFPNTMQGDEMQGLRWTVCSVLPGMSCFLIVKIERKKGSLVKFLPWVEERERERERERGGGGYMELAD